MKLRTILLCFLLILTLIPLNTNAQTTVFDKIDIEYSRETGIVQIDGKLIKSASDKTVRLMVLKPDTDMDKLIDGNISFAECGIHATQTEITDGLFEFDNFLINESYKPGDYIIRIASAGEIYTETIPVASVNQVKALVNNVSDSSLLKNYIEKYNDVYGLDVGVDSLYYSMEEADKTYILQMLCHKTYVDNDDFKKQFNLHTLLRKVYVGPWGTLEGVITSNSDVLTLDMTEFELLSADARDNVCKSLCAKTYTTAVDFKDAFDKYVAYEKANKPTGSKPSQSSGSGGTGGSMTYHEPLKKAPEENISSDDKRVVFHDLNGYEWAKPSIELLSEKGIINGKSEGVFDPGAYVTRAEAVKIIVLALAEVDENASCYFTDVNKSSWAYPYIATATCDSIIYGYGNGVFGANDNITREDLAVIVLRAVNAYGIQLDSSIQNIEFEDKDAISPYAKESVDILCSKGIINGSDGRFNPKAFATRAQIAKIVALIIS